MYNRRSKIVCTFMDIDLFWSKFLKKAVYIGQWLNHDSITAL